VQSTFTQEDAMTNSTEQFEVEITMFDFAKADMDACLVGMTQRDIARTTMSLLSNVQEMIARDYDKETVRRAINRAKYFVDQIR
jgi:hypothetical protein